jgi:hypothetical protein
MLRAGANSRNFDIAVLLECHTLPPLLVETCVAYAPALPAVLLDTSALSPLDAGRTMGGWSIRADIVACAAAVTHSGASEMEAELRCVLSR